MIVVGGGSSTRFGADKLLTRVAGAPLVEHTIRSVVEAVDKCVLVCRPDQMKAIRSLELAIDLAPGGDSRTRSEVAGLAALDGPYDLVGVHDAARPLASRQLVESVFDAAARHGGAIPVLAVSSLVNRSTLAPITGLSAAQTPQVFETTSLRRAYRAAEDEGFEGHDTAAVVARYTDTRVVTVPGDPTNVKVTYPEDLDLVETLLEERARIGPP